MGRERGNGMGSAGREKGREGIEDAGWGNRGSKLRGFSIKEREFLLQLESDVGTLLSLLLFLLL